MNDSVMNHSQYFGPCGFCKRPTEHVCQRCGDLYCSQECQRKDWQRHRYICYAVPTLVHSKEFYNGPHLQSGGNSGIGNYAINAANVNGMHQQCGPQSQMELQRQVMQLQQNLNSLLNQQQQQSAQNQQQTKQCQQQQMQQQLQSHSLGNSGPLSQQKQNQRPSENKPNLHQQQQSQHNLNQRSNPIQTSSNNNKQQQQKQQPQKQQNQSPKRDNILASKENKPQTSPVDNSNQQPIMATGAYPKDNSRVIVTGFRSVNRCSVRDLSAENNAAFAEIVEKVNAAGKLAKPLPFPRPEQFALSKNQGCWHRVQILKYKKGNFVRVLFVDFGFCLLRKTNEIYEISKAVLSLPKCTFQVQLNGVFNYHLNKNMIDVLNEYTNVQYKIVFNDKDNTNAYHMPKVELFNWETDESLNGKFRKRFSGLSQCSDSTMTLCDDVLKEEQPQQSNNKTELLPVNENTSSSSSSSQAGFSKSDAISILDNYMKKLEAAPVTKTTNNNKQPAPVLVPPFKIKKLPVGETNIDIFIVDNSHLPNGKIGCLALSDGGILSQTQLYLKSFSDTVPYTPVKAEYVIAKYEDDWYRAKVLEVNSDNKTCKIFLVDFTNETNIGVDLIRRYPMDFTVECVTNLCRIANLPALALREAQVKFLETKLQTNSFIPVDGISIEENAGSSFLCLELKELIKEFNDKFLET